MRGPWLIDKAISPWVFLESGGKCDSLLPHSYFSYLFVAKLGSPPAEGGGGWVGPQENPTSTTKGFSPWNPEESVTVQCAHLLNIQTLAFRD